jgi:ABC-type enterochelin transport system permease subunit
MTPNEFMQIIQIGLTLGLIIYLVDKLQLMKYNLLRIFLSPFQYAFIGVFRGKWDTRYLEPADWFVDNLAYLCYMLIAVGKTFSFFALLQQVRLHQIEEKSAAWFIASPMVTVGIIGLVVLFEGKLSAKRMYAGFKQITQP